MTAWQHLLANSALPAGTAWQLLTNPRAGTGLVVSDGIALELSTMQVDVELEDAPVIAEVADEPLTVELSTAPIEVEIAE